MDGSWKRGEDGYYNVSQTQKNCIWNEINVVIAAAAAAVAAALVPNKLLDFLVWINVMSQCLFCLQTNLDTICGPLHTLQCNAFALVTHLLASPPPPSLLFFMPCVTACLGPEQQPCGETRAEDFNLTAESFPIGLTVITEGMILFIWLSFVMQPCGGREYFPDRIRCFSRKVREWTENHTCDHSDYPQRSGLQFRGKVTLHCCHLQKCHLSVIFLGLI